MLPHFTIWGFKAELVLLLVASWSILRGVEEGLTWAIVGGVSLDLFSSAPFGTMTMALVATAYGLGRVGTSLLRTNPFLPIAATPVATLIFNVIAAAVLEGFGWQIDWPQIIAGVVGPLSLINSAAMVLVFALLCRVNDRLERQISW